MCPLDAAEPDPPEEVRGAAAEAGLSRQYRYRDRWRMTRAARAALRVLEAGG